MVRQPGDNKNRLTRFWLLRPIQPRLALAGLAFMGKQAVKIDFGTVRTEDLIFRIVTPYLIGQKYPILA